MSDSFCCESGSTIQCPARSPSERGQTTTEYALVMLAAAAVAGLVLAWATKSHAISRSVRRGDRQSAAVIGPVRGRGVRSRRALRPRAGHRGARARAARARAVPPRARADRAGRPRRAARAGRGARAPCARRASAPSPRGCVDAARRTLRRRRRRGAPVGSGRRPGRRWSCATRPHESAARRAAVSRRRAARDAPRCGPSDERPSAGNVSVIAVAGVGLAFVLCLGVARVGAAVVLKARADTAADAAALAGADALALGQSSADAVDAARGRRPPTTARGSSRARAPGDAAEVAWRSACGRARTVTRGRRSISAGHRRSRHEAEQRDRAALVEVLVPVAALRRLHARRAAVVARARGDEIERRAHVACARPRTRARRCPAPPG